MHSMVLQKTLPRETNSEYATPSRAIVRKARQLTANKRSIPPPRGLLDAGKLVEKFEQTKREAVIF